MVTIIHHNLRLGKHWLLFSVTFFFLLRLRSCNGDAPTYRPSVKAYNNSSRQLRSTRLLDHHKWTSLQTNRSSLGVLINDEWQFEKSLPNSSTYFGVLLGSPFRKTLHFEKKKYDKVSLNGDQCNANRRRRGFCPGYSEEPNFTKRPKCKSFEGKPSNKYILLDVLLCNIAEYFYALCRILASP